MAFPPNIAASATAESAAANLARYACDIDALLQRPATIHRRHRLNYSEEPSAYAGSMKKPEESETFPRARAGRARPETPNRNQRKTSVPNGWHRSRNSMAERVGFE